MTPSQLAAVESWRENFNPGALRYLEEAIKAFRHFVARGSDEKAKLAGLEALLTMAREMAVRE